jgi:hypothetical protein
MVSEIVANTARHTGVAGGLVAGIVLALASGTLNMAWPSYLLARTTPRITSSPAASAAARPWPARPPEPYARTRRARDDAVVRGGQPAPQPS